MFRYHLYISHFNLLIIVTLIASFHTNTFPQETEQNQQNVQYFSTLEIISEPGNAQVFVNQKYKGVTPCTIDSLRTGTHSIELKLDNYKPFSEKITVKEGDYKKLVIELSKIQKKIVQFIKRTPGCSQTEISNQLGLIQSKLNYHINMMVDARIIKVERDGNKTRCFIIDEAS